jgi:hypothetical protein
MKYYRVTVTLKNGFTYSYTCIGKMLEGMKKSSESYWTEKVVSEEINQEDFKKTREVTFEEDKVLRKATVKSGKVVDKGKLLEPEKATEKKVRTKRNDKVSEPVELEPVKATTTKTKRKPKLSNLEDFFNE